MKLYGVKASNGYAVGKAYKLISPDIKISTNQINDIEAEKQRLLSAIENSKLQITKIRQTAVGNIGESEAAVFDSHLMILDDPEFIDAAMNNITKERINAEKAIGDITDTFLAIFESIDDEYMRERAADIKDVSKRVIMNLVGQVPRSLSDVPPGSVIIAYDLSPSDTAQLDKSKVVGFATCIGGKTSHSAIMARTLEIPAVVGIENIINNINDDDTLIVDGNQGMIIINPSSDTIDEYQLKMLSFQKEKDSLKAYTNAQAITPSGKRITVAGNIGSVNDVENVIEKGADAIGLFRTEFLFMDRANLPGEDEQFRSYKTVTEKMNGKPVVIRTLDIGGDKKLDYLPLQKEENPFLGYRAIRLCLDQVHIFKTQLRAILRASYYGKIQVMFPMISSVDEFLRAKSILNECKDELAYEGIPFDNQIEIGIMIEIPSAAILADEFAKVVDFFSIGTNDLTQYTLAVDRMNEKISHLYDPMHPAVMKLIKMTIDAAHNAGKWCGMCGELAGDEKAIPLLLEYGLDELSMSASSILKAKKIIIGS